MKPVKKKIETVWVCGACGKQADDRKDFKDVSCYLHAVECDPKSLKLDKRGLVTYADPVAPKTLLEERTDNE